MNVSENFDGGRAFTFDNKNINDVVHKITTDNLEVHLGKIGE